MMVTWDDGSGGGKKQLEAGYFFKMEPTRPANGLSGRRCCCSVAKLCLNLCDPMDRSTLGLLVSHYLPEFTQVHVY